MTSPTDLESRVRAALTGEAGTVDPAGDSLEAIRRRARSAHRRRRTALAGAGAAALVAVVVAVPLAGDGDPDVTTRSDTPSTREAPDPTTPTTEAPDPPDGTPTGELRYQPLWPFATQAEADQWLREGLPGGHQPWHSSAEATAQFFTQNYLGFSEIDRITSADVGATDAWIGVGYESEPGFVSTAAVVHLVRFGPDAAAPWEVVGTRDTDLTLDTPRYGSALSSPLTVGGTVSGVDESLQVQVRQMSSTEALGETCCLPAGGTDSPWEMTVADVAPATDPAVTVVVFTGGHVQDVERFAITGLRT